MIGHLVARARPGLLPLVMEETSAWLWDRLTRAFPLALAAVLMPNHLHLVACLGIEARRKLAAVLGALAREFRLGEVWQPVAEPQALATPDKVARTVRYVLLNPCRPWRAGREPALASDPLAWPWSTHRDVIGAIADPWVEPERVAAGCGFGEHDFERRWHAYVSCDPHVNVAGTPLPAAAPPSDIPARPLMEITGAVAATTRGSADTIRQRGPARRIWIALAQEQGWQIPNLLAKGCDAHPSTIQRLTGSCPPEWLRAAARCLGDPRLSCSSPNATNRLVWTGTKVVRPRTSGFLALEP